MSINCIDSKLLWEVDPKLPPNILKELTQQVLNNPDFVTSTMSDQVIHTDIRKSTNSWLYSDHWIAGVIYNLFASANQAFFHYNLDHFGDGIQITVYEEGDFFNWHTDGYTSDAYDERKLSISLLLTDDYEGGELEFELKPQMYIKKPKAGSAIIFPSWLPHRVKPIKSGKRVSLVAWMNGPVFR